MNGRDLSRSRRLQDRLRCPARRRLRLAVLLPRFSSHRRTEPGSAVDLEVAVGGGSAQEKALVLVRDMAVAPAAAHIAWAEGFPHRAQSTILTRSIRKSLST